jgi:hypothetical protein
MAQQTAIEWFFENLNSHKIQLTANELFEQAKQKEKEQIKEAYNHGWDDREYEVEDSWKKDADEKYFNETYGQ